MGGTGGGGKNFLKLKREREEKREWPRRSLQNTQDGLSVLLDALPVLTFFKT